MFHWLPSHADVQGNEDADTAAKFAIILHQAISPVEHSLSSIKSSLCSAFFTTLRADLSERISRDSTSAHWYYIATAQGIVPATLSANRLISVASHWIKLGCKCVWELDGSESQVQSCSFGTEEQDMHSSTTGSNARALSPSSDVPSTRLLG